MTRRKETILEEELVSCKWRKEEQREDPREGKETVA